MSRLWTIGMIFTGSITLVSAIGARADDSPLNPHLRACQENLLARTAGIWPGSREILPAASLESAIEQWPTFRAPVSERNWHLLISLKGIEFRRSGYAEEIFSVVERSGVFRPPQLTQVLDRHYHSELHMVVSGTKEQLSGLLSNLLRYSPPNKAFSRVEILWADRPTIDPLRLNPSSSLLIVDSENSVSEVLNQASVRLLEDQRPILINDPLHGFLSVTMTEYDFKEIFSSLTSSSPNRTREENTFASLAEFSRQSSATLQRMQQDAETLLVDDENFGEPLVLLPFTLFGQLQRLRTVHDKAIRHFQTGLTREQLDLINSCIRDCETPRMESMAEPMGEPGTAQRTLSDEDHRILEEFANPTNGSLQELMKVFGIHNPSEGTPTDLINQQLDHLPFSETNGTLFRNQLRMISLRSSSQDDLTVWRWYQALKVWASAYIDTRNLMVGRPTFPNIHQLNEFQRFYELWQYRDESPPQPEEYNPNTYLHAARAQEAKKPTPRRRSRPQPAPQVVPDEIVQAHRRALQAAQNQDIQFAEGRVRIPRSIFNTLNARKVDIEKLADDIVNERTYAVREEYPFSVESDAPHFLWFLYRIEGPDPHQELSAFVGIKMEPYLLEDGTSIWRIVHTFETTPRMQTNYFKTVARDYAFNGTAFRIPDDHPLKQRGLRLMVVTQEIEVKLWIKHRIAFEDIHSLLQRPADNFTTNRMTDHQRYEFSSLSASGKWYKFVYRIDPSDSKKAFLVTAHSIDY